MDDFEKILELQQVDHAISLFGNFDENARIIEDGLNVKMISGDRGIRITGGSENVEKAYAVLEKLISIIERGDELSRQNVRYLVDLAAEGMMDKITEYSDDHICVTARGRHIKSRTHGQRRYVRAIRDNTVVFRISPAGTGKISLLWQWRSALSRTSVNRMSSDAAGSRSREKLGFARRHCRTRSILT